MRRAIGIGLLTSVLAGCGSAGLRGALEWTGVTRFSELGSVHGVSGHVRNTTSHAIDLHPAEMRLLDAGGRKVRGRISLGRMHLPPHGITRLSVRWRAGKPVRIDYGSGTLRLTSG